MCEDLGWGTGLGLFSVSGSKNPFWKQHCLTNKKRCRGKGQIQQVAFCSGEKCKLMHQGEIDASLENNPQDKELL